MKKYIFFLGIFILLFQSSFSQTIENIRYQREENKMKISYSIKDAKFYQIFNISIYVSMDNGENFIGPLSFVSGDVGENITAGKNKSIYWDVFKELDVLKGEVIFDIRAKVKKDIAKKYFVIYQGNNITPYGLKVGHVSIVGWYVSAFANTNFNLYDYEFEKNMIKEYPVDQYYIVTDDKKYSRYSITVGMNYQFLKNLYLNLGAGYGYKELNQIINEYLYDNNTYLKQSYAKNVSESYSGLELELGIMYSWRYIVLSGGVNSLNFKRLDWNIGVGYCF
ncbi:MAG: hypothetical protein KOO66_06990 [Bacteroidales bacterium]|nr:hypothetical protein [Bacteroidales bacterium]